MEVALRDLSEIVTQLLLLGPHAAGLGVHGVGRRRAGQAAAAVAELHALHGRHHLRGGLDDARRAAGGGQGGAAEALQEHPRLGLGRLGRRDEERHPHPRPGQQAGTQFNVSSNVVRVCNALETVNKVTTFKDK